MEKMKCPTCFGEGAKPKCHTCGQVSFEVIESDETKRKSSVVVPAWYVANQWDSSKIIYTDNPGRTKTLEILDNLIKLGEIPDFSAMFLLPINSGKRIAIYTLIQKYIARGFTVAPVIDITTLNICLNRNRFEDQQLLLDIFSSDITFIYSTDFVTRKNAARLFEGICSTRALSGRATLFFGAHTFKELSSWGSGLAIDNNQIRNDKLAHPLIFDGVAERIIHEQIKSD